MPFIENFRYRADIDGLRAIAVSAVVFYHADFSCSGGFIGVDVFFVISGFLITSLIWKDLESGRFTFASFWERRARRIVPLLVVVTLAALVAGYFFLLPADFKSLGRAAAAQSIFGANIHYWLDSGYFSSVADEKPLLHTWSLAVEEQFYLIVPIVFWKMFRVFRSRSAIIAILIAGFIVSLAASIYGVQRSPSATFYLLPTRAWELLTGSILAFLPAVNIRQYLREGLSFFGLALILFPVFLYTSETPFPGYSALAPCFGAALLIYANSSPTIIGSILSTRPIVFIGLISYSLYLWHWLFFAYGKYLSLEPLPFRERLILVLLGFLLAILSWKYIETPFRTRKIAASRKSVFLFAGSGLTAIFVCGVMCILLQGFPQRFSTEKIEFANAVSDMDFINEVTVDEARSGKFPPIGASNASPTVLVWGDSHAMAAMPAFDAFLKEKGLGGRAATHSSTAPVIGWYIPTKKVGLDEEAIVFNDAVILYIKNNQISDVVLVAFWLAYTKNDEFKSALLTTIKQIADAGARPWVMLDMPFPSFNVPKALSRSDYSADYLESLYSSEVDFESQFIVEMKAAGARILNPKSSFMDSTGYHIIQSQGIALYRDEHHLTTKGARLILLPFLRDSFTLGN